MALLARSTQAIAAKPSRARVVSVRAEVPAKVDRPLYTGASKSALTYLDGSKPGDYGFDPLGLLDPENSGGFVNPDWLRYSEIIHARYAMLGAAGCIAPEILSKAGVIPDVPVWYQTSVIPPAGQYEAGYWTDPMSLFLVEVVAMQFAELRRWQDFKNPGCMSQQYFMGIESIFAGSGDANYPGGQWFNMAGMGKDEKEMMSLKKKELENGRLAMLAMFGYGAQAVITREGPYENLCKHLSDPTGNNILTSFGHVFGGQ